MSKKKRLSRALILFITGLLLALGILDYVAPRIDVTPYQKEITSSISQILQRKFVLDDKIYLKLSLKPTIVSGKLVIENPAWCRSSHFLKANEAEFGIDVIDFLLGKITIDRLIVRQASLNLELAEKNKNNWTFGRAKGPEQEKGKSGSPIRLDYMVLDDVNIRFFSPTQQKALYIKHSFLKKSLRGRYKLDFDGALNNKNLVFQAASNRWFDMQDFRPFNLKLETDMKDNNLSVNVAVQQFVPRLQASLKVDSRQLNIDDLMKQFLFDSSKNERASSNSVFDEWLNKIDFLSVDLKIDKLFYKQREINNILSRSQLVQDVFRKDDRFSAKSTGKISKIIQADVKKTDLLQNGNMPRPGQADYRMTSKGDSVQELIDKAGISFNARDITGSKPGPYNIKNITAETDDEGRLNINGEINYNNHPVNVTAQSGKNFLGELKKQAMGHVDMVLSTNGSTVKINSTSRDVFKTGGRKIHIRLSGNKLKEWQGIVGRELPLLDHYKLESRFEIQKKGIRVNKFIIRTPRSRLRGKSFYRFGKRGTLNVLVDNSRLALADLKMEADMVQKNTGKKSASNEMVIPKTDLMKLLSPAMDVNLEVRSSDLIFNKFTLHDLGLKTRWGEQVLATQVYKGRVSDGALTADIYLTIVDEEAAGKIEMNIHQLDYGKLMQEVGLGDKMKGKADVNVHLVGFGKDLKEFLTHSDGTMEFVGEKGILASKYLRLWGEDIVQTILPFNWFGREQTNLNCVVGRFDLTDGRLSSDSLLLDTETMTIAGTGAVNLGNEELAFELMPDPKNISLLSLATPVKIRGTLAKPRIEPHALGTTWTIGSLLAGLANPAILIARFAKLGSLGENPCLAAIGKKEGEEEETSLLKMFKDAVKFIQRPFDKLPDLE